MIRWKISHFDDRIVSLTLACCVSACAAQTSQTPPQSTAVVPRGAENRAPQLDLATRNKNAYAAATRAAAQGDLKQARALLEAIVPEAKENAGDDMEFWLHNELTWVHWADGDLNGALVEVDAAKDALDRSTLDEASRKKMKLHELWDRAYVKLEIAIAAPAENRAALFSSADDARNEYQELALVENDHDGMAVLEAFFAVRKGDGNHAKLAAKRVDVAQDSDLQDLYVIALAFEVAGDFAQATDVRERLCGGHEYLMKPLILRQLAREGHMCPHP